MRELPQQVWSKGKCILYLEEKEIGWVNLDLDAILASELIDASPKHWVSEQVHFA